MHYIWNVLRSGIFCCGRLSRGLRVHDPCNRNEMSGWILLPSQVYGIDRVPRRILLRNARGTSGVPKRQLLRGEKHVARSSEIGLLRREYTL